MPTHHLIPGRSLTSFPFFQLQTSLPEGTHRLEQALWAHPSAGEEGQEEEFLGGRAPAARGALPPLRADCCGCAPDPARACARPSEGAARA